MIETSLPAAHRARNAVWASFFLMGIVSMAWVPRIPEIKRGLGFSDAAFGLVFLASACGAAIGAQSAGRLVHRFGSKSVARYARLAMPGGLVVMGMAAGPATLVGGLFVMGLGYAAMDVAVNTQGVAVERHTGARYMASFHGSWSVGALVTTVIGGVIGEWVSPRANLVGVGVVAAVLLLVATPRLLDGDLDGHDGGGERLRSHAPWIGSGSATLWLIALGAVGALVAETAASDWGALLLEEDLGIRRGVSATAFAAFALAMVVSRLSGDRVLGRFGTSRTLRWSGLLGGVGLAAGILVARAVAEWSPGLALVVVVAGFMAAGLAIGPMFPALILWAASIPGLPPSVAIARVGVVSLAGLFVGPPVVGAISEARGLTVAMMYPAAMLLVVAAIAARLGRPQHA